MDPYPRPKKVFADKTLIIPGIINEPSANLPEVKIFKKSFENVVTKIIGSVLP